MAVAKKRKGAAPRNNNKKRAKVMAILAKAKTKAGIDPRELPWARKLHSSHLMFLRRDPDFLTSVKLGRVMNALSYCVTNILTFTDFNSNKTHLRQLRRTLMMLGGFLHEAFEVVDQVKGSYLGQPEFERLRSLVLDYEFLPTRKKAKKVRNYISFHLDGHDDRTSTGIAQLPPATYTLWCGENKRYGSHYFELADILDMSYLGDIFPSEDDIPADEAGERVLMEMGDFTVEFLKAAHTLPWRCS